MAQEKQAEPYRIFYYGNVQDPSTRWPPSGGCFHGVPRCRVFLGSVRAFFRAVHIVQPARESPSPERAGRYQVPEMKGPPGDPSGPF
jgi:hypothetical protein